uniref:Uncharacterized protein n=1 Tax=Phlebotomus papatasi TaxID=29031 RepID=A0A1B0EWS2_PHLPP
MIVREGYNVSLHCAAVGSPEPTITWRRERGKPLLSVGSRETVFSAEGPSLMIPRVNRHHMGAYLCIASNGIPPTVSKRIMVIVNCEYNDEENFQMNFPPFEQIFSSFISLRNPTKCF